MGIHVKTTDKLIKSKLGYPAGTLITTGGFTSVGDGGSAQWLATSTVGQTPSQTPTQLANAELTDGHGRKWSYVGIVGTSKMESYVEAMGGFTGQNVSAILSLLANNGISAILQKGESYFSESANFSNGTLYGNGATLELPVSSTARNVINTSTTSVCKLFNTVFSAANGTVGNYCVQINSGGIEAHGCTFIDAQNIAGYGDGVVIASSNLESKFLNCTFSNNGSNGLSVQESPQIVVRSCQALNNTATGFNFNNYDGSLTKSINNITISDCRSRLNGANGFVFGNPYNDNDFTGDDFGWSNGVVNTVMIDGCTADNNTTYGFVLSMSIGTISNCIAKENTFGGVLVNGDEISIDGCLITRNDTFGIDIGHGRNITMTGGEVSFNSTSGGSPLLIESSVNVSVVGTSVFSNGNGTQSQVVINAVGGTGSGEFFPSIATNIYLKCQVSVGANEVGLAVRDNPVKVTDANIYDGPTSAVFTRVQSKTQNYVLDYNGKQSNSFTPTVTSNVAVFPDIAKNLVLNTTDNLNSIEPYSYNYFKDKVAYIEVSNGGSGYTVGSTTMTIVGDGAGATLLPIINNGVIVGARVESFGSGYTAATVSIVGDGTSAAATASVGIGLFYGKEIGLSHNQPQTLVRAGDIILNNPANADLSAVAAGYTTLVERFGQWLLKSKNY